MGGIAGTLSTVAVWLLFAAGLTVADQASPASQHLRDLPSYETQHQDTIVRSFFPIYGEKPAIGDHEMIFFNISAVSGNEEISRARLHLHRRRISKAPPRSRDPLLLPAPSRIVLYQARSPDARPRKLASLPISSRTPGGWVPVDVTAVLRELHGRPLLLGVRFEGPKNIRLTINNFLKHSKTKKIKSSSAYLIVLSKSDLEEGLDEPRERHLKHKERKADQNEMPNEISSLPLNAEVRHRSKHKVYEVRRSKEAELELRRRTHLQSLPFLHVDEVANMRRSLRKAKRSVQLEAPNTLQLGKTKLNHGGKNSQQSHSKQTSSVTENVSCQRRKEIPFSVAWLMVSSFKSKPVCEGHCHLFEPTSEGGAQKGCCRLRHEDALTFVMEDDANSLALHKLPGNGQVCHCVPCQ